MALLFQLGKSVKDKVILTLGSIWPLKAKEILSYIKNNFNANVTYQAVYKSVNELIEEGVIVKTGKGLMLNKEWVGSLRDYTNYVDQSYKLDIPKKELMNSEQITLSCIWDWYYHVLLTLEKFANDEYATKNPVVVRGTHEWNCLALGKEEFTRAIKVIKKYNIYSTVLIDTLLGQTLTKYWEQMGVHIAMANKDNFPESGNIDTVIIGSYVIQAIYPKELIDALCKSYDETKNLEELDIVRFQQEIFYKKADIHVITVKNKALADKIRKETLEVFKS